MTNTRWLDITREREPHMPRFSTIHGPDLWRLTYEIGLRRTDTTRTEPARTGWFLWPPAAPTNPIHLFIADPTNAEEAKHQADMLIAGLTAPDPDSPQ